MFESLRKNIQSVQDGISAGLQRLSVGERGASSSGTDSKDNLHAGSDLLNMYQTQWATMHHMAEQNASKAESIDCQITQVVQKCESQHNQVLEIHSLLAHLPNIMSQLHSMLNTIGQSRSLFEEVEAELLALEQLDEELQLQEKVLDFRLQLALHREKYVHDLIQRKGDLLAEHEIKMCKIEQIKEEKRKELEKNLNEKILKDMQEFKEKGKIPARACDPIVGRSGIEMSIEDVELEQDNETLESFLKEPT